MQRVEGGHLRLEDVTFMQIPPSHSDSRVKIYIPLVINVHAREIRRAGGRGVTKISNVGRSRYLGFNKYPPWKARAWGNLVNVQWKQICLEHVEGIT